MPFPCARYRTFGGASGGSDEMMDADARESTQLCAATGYTVGASERRTTTSTSKAHLPTCSERMLSHRAPSRVAPFLLLDFARI